MENTSIKTNREFVELTTVFRINYQDNDIPVVRNIAPDILSCWADVCIKALEMRMESCVSMLFRNRNNVLKANEYHIVFQKSNGQLHSFNIPSYTAMESILETFKNRHWHHLKEQVDGVRQLLKALYWVDEEDKVDHGTFGFGQLISCLEEFTFIYENR